MSRSGDSDDTADISSADDPKPLFAGTSESAISAPPFLVRHGGGAGICIRSSIVVGCWKGRHAATRWERKAREGAREKAEGPQGAGRAHIRRQPARANPRT